MITLTTEQAQQIEEVLEELCGSIDFYNKYGPDWTHKDGTESFNVSVLLDRADDISKAIIALREALVEQEDEIYWIETNKALAKEIIELKRQAEQEPVGYFAYDEEHDIWEELTGPNAPGATKLYTAPVHTKDLTDDEIMKINVDTAGIVPTCDRQFHFARAVIAADREKNK